MKLSFLIPAAILIPFMRLAKPNIVVILSDDVGWADISANQALADISQRVDHSAPVKGGATDIGFDTFFGTPSNCSRIPVFMRDDRIVGSPKRDETGLIRNPEMRGDTVDDLYVDEAISFMEQPVNDKKPFFVYLPINAAHGAIDVPKEFQGKSGVSSRRDKVLWVNKSVQGINESLGSLGQTV